MICCRCYLVWSLSLRKGVDSGWLGVRVLELPGWKYLRGKQQLLEWLQRNRGFWLLRHVSSSCEGQILTAIDAPRSSACQSLRERSGRLELVKDSPDALGLTWCLWAGESWIINADLLDWCENCVVGWQRADCSGFLKLVTGVPSDSSAMMTEIEEK